MISIEELIKGNDMTWDQIPKEHQINLIDLLSRLNKLRVIWGKPIIITNGYRSLAHHLKIYAAKGITDQSKIPMKSQHLSGCAADMSDPDGSLKAFVKANDYQVLKDCELWMEAADSTNGWLHNQSNPPKSGAREFEP